MTVYELIQELTRFPADMEVFAEVGSTAVKFDVGGVESEFRYPNPKGKDNRAVVVLDPY